MKTKSTFKLFILAVLLISLTCNVSENKKPVIYIIGDSTVKNGSGKGVDGMWGWGDMISEYFDTSKITIENHAIGGRNTRTFRFRERWANILEKINPGDFVLMQFGHNDGAPVLSRAYGSLRGNSADTIHVPYDSISKETVVHTYGWYLRQYIKETKMKGATPLVLSQVPRNMWIEEKVILADSSYGKWAKEAAKEENALFINLNNITAEKYELLGPEKVKEMYFPGDHSHTNKDGAIVNAESVVQGIRKLDTCELKNFLNNKGNSL